MKAGVAGGFLMKAGVAEDSGWRLRGLGILDESWGGWGILDESFGGWGILDESWGGWGILDESWGGWGFWMEAGGLGILDESWGGWGFWMKAVDSARKPGDYVHITHNPDSQSAGNMS